ncbi:unnamed protein product [Closterium sp. Naga37s-1]|nr:unnamed protein product [Closterium sp. Naga37s-1]
MSRGGSTCIYGNGSFPRPSTQPPHTRSSVHTSSYDHKCPLFISRKCPLALLIRSFLFRHPDSPRPTQRMTSSLDTEDVSGFIIDAYNVTVLHIAAAFLVDASPVGKASSSGVWNINLDKPHSSWAKLLDDIDVFIFNAGHWFVNAPDSLRQFYIGGVKQSGLTGFAAMKIALTTVRNTIVKSNFRGTPVLLTFSPFHYSDSFDTGKDCAGWWRPMTQEEFQVALEKSEAAEAVKEQLAVFTNSGGSGVTADSKSSSSSKDSSSSSSSKDKKTSSSSKSDSSSSSSSKDSSSSSSSKSSDSSSKTSGSGSDSKKVVQSSDSKSSSSKSSGSKSSDYGSKSSSSSKSGSNSDSKKSAQSSDSSKSSDSKSSSSTSKSGSGSDSKKSSSQSSSSSDSKSSSDSSKSKSSSKSTAMEKKPGAVAQSFGTSYTQFGNVKFSILDITLLSLIRPDAHIQTFGGEGSKVDCSHWCTPGLPDTWSDILYSMLMN